MNVYIPTENITDMRGPCPEGFHIPTIDEWNNFRSIYNNIVDSGDRDTATHLYVNIGYCGVFTDNGGSIHFAISKSNANYYRLCENYDKYRAYDTIIMSKSIGQGGPYHLGKSNLYLIRPFSDSVIEPSVGRTTIYQGEGTNGIYHNSTLGIITLIYDTNKITIADRDAGASSAGGQGLQYQRGNNYGFNYSAGNYYSFINSTINASSYGPGNYYNSGTTPRASRMDSTTYFWDSSNNKNLRGGETGPLKMNELKNAYIGEYIPLIQNASLLGNTNTKQDVQGAWFSPDGTKMIVGFWNLSYVTEYTLSTPFNPSTKTEIRTLSGTYQNSGMWFNHDGTIMILCTRINSSPFPTNVQKYTLSTPFALNTATLVQNYNAGNGKFTSGVCLSDDGKKIYINIDGEGIYQGTMSAAFDLSTISLSSGTFQSGGRGIALRGNGKILYTSNSNSVGDYGLISQYKLGTPYDILGSKTLLSTFNAGGGEGAALWVSEDMGYFSWCLGGNKSQDVRIFKTN